MYVADLHHAPCSVQEMEPSFNLLSGGDETIDAEEFRQVDPLYHTFRAVTWHPSL